MSKLTIVLIFLLACSLGCDRAPRAGQPSAGPSGSGAAASAPDERAAYRVRRLPPSKQVNVGDQSLAEWTEDLKVMEIPADRASSLQWTTIRNYDPAVVPSSRFALRIYMARSDHNWYLALAVKDESVQAVPTSSSDPHSGDCAELYFAGAQLSSDSDIHDLVADATADQRAFLQLEIPPVVLDQTEAHLASWRTDRSLRDLAIQAGLAVSVWRTRDGWSGEARIPLDAFETSVRKSIAGGEPLKAALTYLDYNTEIAQRSDANRSGFRPDNVFCLDPDERNVNVPKYMRSIIFEH